MDTDTIFLNKQRFHSTSLRAVAHELVHIEHGGDDTAQAHYSIDRHLFLSEEGEAHLADQRAAKKLRTVPLTHQSWRLLLHSDFAPDLLLADSDCLSLHCSCK